MDDGELGAEALAHVVVDGDGLEQLPHLGQVGVVEHVHVRDEEQLERGWEITKNPSR